MTTFLNVHLLSSLAFANPNRDDAGAPKSAVYGGTERARLSSQALKRAARLGFQERVQTQSVRSALAAEIVIDRIEAQGGEPISPERKAVVDQAIRLLVEDNPKVREPEDKEDKDKDSDESGNTLSWYSKAELDAMAKALTPLARSEEKLKEKKTQKALRDLIEEAIDNPSLEIASFGRMFAASPASATDAALQVSHAISTHQYVLEVDYFTAVDDLREHGAGHIGLAMYTGAVYYRHFCIDRAQLQSNMGDQFKGSEDQVKALVEAMLVELPRGKQNSSSHHSLPSLIIVSEGARPANCVEAFEQPVSTESGGYVLPSAAALASYMAEMSTFAPTVFGKSWIGGRKEPVELAAAEIPSAQISTLPALVDAMASWIAEPSR